MPIAHQILCGRSAAFADTSHLMYYSQPLRRRNEPQNRSTTPHSLIRCEATGGKPVRSSNSRTSRVKRQAAMVAQTLERLELQEPLASYPLSNLSRTSSVPMGSIASSSSSESSEDERTHLPSSSYTARLQRASNSAAQAASAPYATIAVCQGKACQKRGSHAIMASLQGMAPAGVAVGGCKCLGQCKKGPAVQVHSASGEEVVYVNVNPNEPRSAAHLATVVLQ